MNKISAPEGTVIVGIIDVGIALGHRRFRDENGKTRFIAAWQQSAIKGKKQRYLGYGRELYANDINRLLKKHSGGDLLSTLDEDAFNRDAGLIAPESSTGNRDLEYRSSHGTHVLDLASGFDPNTTKVDLDLCKIIAVNLPPRSVHGSAGNFLTKFATYAVDRILFLADALWEANFGNALGGYPVVINFSFGKQAGPKDGRSIWEDTVRDVIRNRECVKGVPTRLVMPVGNSNLLRSHARGVLKGRKGGPEGDRDLSALQFSAPWRLQPSDQTSNFVEVWCEARASGRNRRPRESRPGDYKLFITPPNCPPAKVPKLKPGQYSDLSEFARVYCYGPRGQDRPHFVICTTPTQSYDGKIAEAPAGLWTISIAFRRGRGLGAERHDITFTVQTDQAGLRYTVVGKQSYFDHEKYQPYEETGRIRDTFAPGKNRHEPGEDLEPYEQFGPVQRKGSQNALATWDGVIVVGGYRINDYRVAPYSSTFEKKLRDKALVENLETDSAPCGHQGGKVDIRREEPTVLYPTDDGAAHTGMLAAGARDGSTVALQGTSMATALATRDIAAMLQDWKPGRSPADFDSEAELRKRAKKDRERTPGMKLYDERKQGAGLIVLRKMDKAVTRFGVEDPCNTSTGTD